MYVSNYSCLVCFTRNHRSKTRALTPIFHELVYVVKNALMLANLAELPLVQHHATLICQQQQHLYFRYLLTPSLSLSLQSTTISLGAATATLQHTRQSVTKTNF